MNESKFKANLAENLLNTEKFNSKEVASYVCGLISENSECKFALVKRYKEISIYQFNIRYGRDFYLLIQYNEISLDNGTFTLHFSGEELSLIKDYMQRSSAEDKRLYFFFANRSIQKQEVYFMTLSAEEYVKFLDDKQGTLCFKMSKPNNGGKPEKFGFSLMLDGKEIQKVRSNRMGKIVKETTYKGAFRLNPNTSSNDQRLYNTDIKKRHYYFGAALTMFFDRNIECKPSIVESLDETSLYLFTTNTSEFYLLMKHTENCKLLSKGSKNGSLSWTIKFTDKDRELITKYRNTLTKSQQLYILIICSEGDFLNTRFLLLHLEDYDKLSNQQSITFRLDRGTTNYKKSFSVCKKDGQELSIECSRVKKELIKR